MSHDYHMYHEYAAMDNAHRPTGAFPQKGPQPPATDPETPGNAPHSQEPGPRDTSKARAMKVFGKKAALTIEACETRNGFSTVVFEGALAKNNGTKEFDWSEKTIVQLTRLELPRAIAVFMGLSQGISFQNHGPQNNKGLEIQFQGDKIFVSVREGGKPMKGVPVPLDEAMLIGFFLLDALLDNYRHLPADVALRAISHLEKNLSEMRRR